MKNKKESISKKDYDLKVDMYGKKKVDKFYVVKEVKLCPTCGKEIGLVNLTS